MYSNEASTLIFNGKHFSCLECINHISLSIDQAVLHIPKILWPIFKKDVAEFFKTPCHKRHSWEYTFVGEYLDIWIEGNRVILDFPFNGVVVSRSEWRGIMRDFRSLIKDKSVSKLTERSKELIALMTTPYRIDPDHIGNGINLWPGATNVFLMTRDIWVKIPKSEWPAFKNDLRGFLKLGDEHNNQQPKTVDVSIKKPA